jgi:anti-sigma factor RsiW
MKQHPHLSDDRLIEVSLDRSPSVTEREHLGACSVCAARRADLSQLLVATTSAAVAEADAVFTPERLTRQKTRILQRLEQEGRPGKVVTFPAGHMHQLRPLRARPGMRWVAGAAAAGIFIGMLAGHYAPMLQQAARQSSFGPASPEAVTVQSVSTTMSEEEFLGRLEMASDSTGGTTLQPLHDLTPLAWEVSAP